MRLDEITKSPLFDHYVKLLNENNLMPPIYLDTEDLESLCSKVDFKFNDDTDDFQFSRSYAIHKMNTLTEYPMPVDHQANHIIDLLVAVWPSAKYLFAKFGRSIPESNKMLVSEFPTWDVNAQVRRYPEGYLILVNRGIAVFLRQIMRTLSFVEDFYKNFENTIAFLGEFNYSTPLPTGEVSISTETCNKLIGKIVYYYIIGNLENCFGYIDKYIGNIGFGRGYYYTAPISEAMIAFVVSHEVAHILCGHLDSGNIMTTFGKSNVIYLNENHIREYDADRLGVTLASMIQGVCLDKKSQFSLPIIPDFFSHYAIAGALIFFALVSIIEDSSNIFEMTEQGNYLKTNTHPSAKSRLAHLKKTLTGSVNPESVAIADIYINYFQSQKSSIIKHIKEEHAC